MQGAWGHADEQSVSRVEYVSSLPGGWVTDTNHVVVGTNTLRSIDIDLLDDGSGHIRRVQEKGAEESDRRKLHGKAEAVVISAAL
jgi:hypothetical protein